MKNVDLYKPICICLGNGKIPKFHIKGIRYIQCPACGGTGIKSKGYDKKLIEKEVKNENRTWD